MKRISQLVSIFVLICKLSGCGSATPVPAPTEAPAPEAPVAEAAPAEAVALPPIMWQPTHAQEVELLDFAVSLFDGQPYFDRAEINGDQLSIYVLSDPDEAKEAALPILSSICEKFYQMRDSEEMILYFNFIYDGADAYKTAFANSFDLP